MQFVVFKFIYAVTLTGILFLLRCLWVFCTDVPGRCSAILPRSRRLTRARRKAQVIEIPRAKSLEKANANRTALVVAASLFMLLAPQGKSQDAPANQSGTSSDPEIRELRALVKELQSRVEQLESKQADSNSASATNSAEVDHASTVAAQPVSQTASQSASTLSTDDRSILDFLHGTTVNFALDGYYGYNFNQPIGRANLLRAYDVSSNSFSINQANLIFEQAPDPSAGRQFGARLDLQYGQATEAQQGSAANELRPQAYRPLFQAIGTYVAPLGSGLTIDFGKFASSFGIEGNYNKDQINYSRSYWFDFLPFYHMGFRATYSFTPKLALSYYLVNGIQQAEDFNGFKSQAFLLTIKPNSKISWSVNYYTGQEQPDVVPVLNPGLPAGPTQAGLPVANISPAPSGREHILDSYVTWTPKPKLTLAAEGDYVINRVLSQSSPAHDDGGAAYVRYQLTPKFALATRGEYLSDRGALFSGVSQALKENTFTAEYRLAEGFLARAEYRRDYSNRPFFLTDVAGKLDKEQNTATLGLIWWMGRKQGSW
ncbi:MAG TPA: outer membrane beta-barrel protein [Terriglobales bacterium]|nr:outer membrane beta-barrel protein [Terriglobales bacterium]